MITSLNVATYPPRRESLIKTLKSVVDQFDLVRVCCNGYSWEMIDKLPQYHNVTYHVMKWDKADNAKFHPLDWIDKPELFCCGDDDLIYPPDYRQKIEVAIKEFGCIVSYHGRQLLGEGLNYYKGHRSFTCLGSVSEDEMIDVPGTGVMGFDTRYFHPKGLADAKDLRMADLVFGLEAAKQGKQIGVLKHAAGWIKHINNKETIYETESRNGIKRQNEIADEIYRLRHENNP